MHSSVVVGKEMTNERCEIGLDLVDEEILENQPSMSSNSDNHNNINNQNNNNNNNNNTTTTTKHEKQDQPFLAITPPTTTTANNIIHHFSTNGMCNNNSSSCKHEQVDQFRHISTTTTSSSTGTTNKEQADLLLPPISTSNNNIPSHFLSSTAPRTKNINNNDTTGEEDPFVSISNANNSNQNFYPKGCRKNNNNGSCSTPATNNNKEQDRFLPIANVGRIMKKFIPGNGKISKDAKETVQECVSEFISFVTGEASDKCQREKRKTINGDDIIWAITTLGFEDYVTPLKQYLNKYRELEGEKLNVPKQQRNNDHHQKPNLPNYHHNVYSSPSLLSQPTFAPSDQPFPLPFPQTSNIQTRLPQHEHIDSVGNW